MKKIIIAIATLFISFASVSAQDLAAVTDLFNNGAAALSSGEKASALETFKKALAGAEALGDAGKEIVQNCKNVIPNIVISLAKDLFKEGKFDEAIAKAKEAAGVAEQYAVEEAKTEALTLASQFLSQKAAAALNNKDFAAAVEIYKQVVAENPADGKSYLRLGQALAGTGDFDAAVEAYKQAAANGQEASAEKQISGAYLKAASLALKEKNYKQALQKALASAEVKASANAYKIAGNAAAQLKDYKGAVEYFSKYLEINPKAADAAQVKTNIEAFKKLVK